jgi:hypothetical protein
MARRTCPPTEKRGVGLSGKNKSNNKRRLFGRRQYYNRVLLLIVMYRHLVVVIVFLNDVLLPYEPRWWRRIAEAGPLCAQVMSSKTATTTITNLTLVNAAAAAAFLEKTQHCWAPCAIATSTP